MNTITTIMGDTWDTIAQRAYGGRSQDLTASSLALPRHTQLLMEARENIRLLDYQVFPTGIVVAVPEADDYESARSLTLRGRPLLSGHFAAWETSESRLCTGWGLDAALGFAR